MKDDKFIVFHRDDWDKHGQLFAEEFEADYAIEDATVIRGQDIFAASAFFNYSNNVITTMEILGALAEDVSPEFQEVLDDLQRIADHFHDLGVASAEMPNKLPD